MKLKQRLLSLTLITSIIVGNTMISNASTNIKDIKGHWAESTIKSFVSKGYVGGYEDGTFRPNNSITRAEFVNILNNYFGLTKKSGKVFDDTKSHWAKVAIDVAVTNGVCNGVTSTSFKPNDPITREQVAVMLSNYKKLSDDNHEEIYKFKDKDQIASYAKDSVEGVVERSYMGGYTDGTFKPKNKITRAEAVSTLSRVHKGAVPPVINTPISKFTIEEAIKILRNNGYFKDRDDEYIKGNCISRDPSTGEIISNTENGMRYYTFYIDKVATDVYEDGSIKTAIDYQTSIALKDVINQTMKTDI